MKESSGFTKAEVLTSLWLNRLTETFVLTCPFWTATQPNYTYKRGK